MIAPSANRVPFCARSTAGLRVTLPDETEVAFPPVTIAQARAALKLFPAGCGAESHKQHVLRLCAQAEILFGTPHVHLLTVWTMGQTAEVVGRLWATACGREPRSQPPSILAPALAAPPIDPGELLRLVEAAASELPHLIPALAGKTDELPLAAALALVETLRSPLPLSRH